MVHILKMVALSACLSLVLSGCAAERSHPGGIVGYAADYMIFPAESKEMQTYRGLLVVAALARIGQKNANEGNATTIVTHINNSLLTISRLYLIARTDCGVVNPPADGFRCPENAYSETFEDKIIDLYDNIYVLAATTLPRDSFREVVNNVASQNIIGALWSSTKLARDIFNTEQRFYGVYRTSLEQQAAMLACQQAGAEACKPGSTPPANSKLAELRDNDNVMASSVYLETFKNNEAARIKAGHAAMQGLETIALEACAWVARRQSEAMRAKISCDVAIDYALKTTPLPNSGPGRWSGLNTGN